MTEIKPGTPLRSACHAICQSRKFETGQGGCAAICMSMLGSARGGPHGCDHAEQVHSDLAQAVIAAAHPALLTGLREAREALRPFSELRWIGELPDDHEFAGDYTVGDIRRARATLAHLDTLLAQEGQP